MDWSSSSDRNKCDYTSDPGSQRLDLAINILDETDLYEQKKERAENPRKV